MEQFDFTSKLVTIFEQFSNEIVSSIVIVRLVVSLLIEFVIRQQVKRIPTKSSWQFILCFFWQQFTYWKDKFSLFEIYILHFCIDFHMNLFSASRSFLNWCNDDSPIVRWSCFPNETLPVWTERQAASYRFIFVFPSTTPSFPATSYTLAAHHHLLAFVFSTELWFSIWNQ